MHKRIIITLLAAAAINVSTARAQTQLLTIEAGTRSDVHRNGVTNNAPFAGFGGAAVLSGVANEDFALVFPFSFETRLADGGVTDLNGFSDIAVRIAGFTFGGGLAGTWDFAPKIKDAALGGSDGLLTINYPFSFGYSGFGKLNLGPQGRMFVQGRYTLMPPELSFAYHTAEDRDAIAKGTVKARDVTQKDSHLLRGAVGYTFDKFIVRAQVIQEEWRYDRIYGNTTGAYDRDSKVYSFGVSFIL